MRLLLIGPVAALVLALLPSPVPAAASSYYLTATSTSDSTASKTVTVACPAGYIVYGFGGATQDSEGQVALTGIYPNEDLTSVTASAQARGGWAGSWSLTAVASCWPPAGHALERIVETRGVPAVCPRFKILYSNGYLVSADVGSPYVDAVVPASDQSSVYVHAGGTPIAGLHLQTIALCGFRIEGPHPFYKKRTEVTVPVGAEATTTAAAPPPDISCCGEAWVFGAGVASTRPGMFIDGLRPGPSLSSGWVRMSRGETSAVSSGVVQDGGTVTVYGVCIGTWY